MNKPDEMTLNLEKIPRQLVADAKAKCKVQEPPRPLRWQIIELLKRWTYDRRPETQNSDPLHTDSMGDGSKR